MAEGLAPDPSMTPNMADVKGGHSYGMKLKSKVRRENDELPDSEYATGPYSHPVYKQVSVANGIINKMNKEEIKRKLAELMLDTRGHKDVLKKRLKNHYKNCKLVQAKIQKQNQMEALYDYYFVIDFEATCDEFNPEGFRHEIIEFPVVLIDARTITVVDEFHEFVRPVINPKLTDFCTKLTGITQSHIEPADVFDVVLRRMEEWIKSHGLGSDKTFALVTDGPWDMSRFMFLQCQWSRILFPKWAKKWVNIRKSFCNYYRIRKAKLVSMLENLGMSFEGHQHSGLDDTRNISRIAMRMLSDGAELRLNEELFRDKRQKNHLQAIVCPLKKENINNKDSDDEELENGIDGESSPQVAVEICSRCSNTQTDKTDLGSNLDQGMSNLSIQCSNCSADASVVEEDSGLEDLLSYYALQKS